MKRPRKGDIISIIFLDHVEYGTEPLECTVIGKLIDIKKDYYTVRSWDVKIKNSKEDIPTNYKDFIIIRRRPILNTYILTT